MAHKITTCTFCGVGCGIYLETSGNHVVGAYPSMSHPSNLGKICVRGWNVHEVASSPERLKTPLIKKDGQFKEASWEEAIRFITDRMKAIRAQHGPDALAFLNSPRCSNEETYLLQKFARAIIGTNNVDHGTGVYCNNSINVLLDMLGAPATTNSISELTASEAILVDGVDLGRQLPTIGGHVIRAKLKGAKLIVMDTRRHRVAESADIFLQLKPGTETLLYGAMAKIIVDRGLMNLPFIKARCRDYEAFLDRLADYDLLAAAEGCGLPADIIESAALTYARAKTAAILYSTGIESRDAESVQAIVNLALLTGHLGRAGDGIYALTEQNNLQGVCDMGMLPDRLPGYGLVADATARARIEAVWKTRLPENPGFAARTVLADRGMGKVKGLWLGRYNPVSTAFFGDAETLKQFELIVVQHLFATGTSQHAHVILPTVAFGEEEVSFTSTDRRIQLATKAVDPAPGLIPAWQQIVRMGQAMGADWKYGSSAEVMDEVGEVVPFYSGASHENLAREYGRQWPCTKDRPLGTEHLCSEEAGGAFKFVPVPKPALAAMPKDYPFTLVFGHSLYYWHKNVLIQQSETLGREYRILLLDYPEGFVEVNTDDARQMGIRDGQKIRLITAGGSASIAARVTPEVRSGSVMVPLFVRTIQEQLCGPLNTCQMAAARIEKDPA